MIYFLVRIFVNALAVAVTILLTPGISVSASADIQFSSLIIFMLIGIVFGLINAFIRSLVLLLTGRMLIGTMGLFMFFINGLLFFLLSVFLPGLLRIESPVYVWSLFAGAVNAIIGTIPEVIFGLDSPAIDEGGESRFYWRWLGFLPSGRYNRIVQTMRVKQVLIQ